MGNLLFQQARDAVENAVSCSSGTEQQDLVYRAKNALQSAYANSSTAEKFSSLKCKSNCKTLRIYIKKDTTLVLFNLSETIRTPQLFAVYL